MKTFSITMVTVLAMGGLALAQPPKAPAQPAQPAKPAAPATPAKQATPAKPADPKAGATTPAKPADPKATTSVAPPAGPPKPPAEIKDALKAMGARRTCKGTGLGHDMKMVDFKGTMANKATLDGWWVQSTHTGTIGTGKTAVKMKMESFMTYDAGTSKWRTLSVMNDGTSMVGWAEMKDGKYEGTSETLGPMGTGQFREHGDMTDPKAGAKMWGEMSVDKGKTWMKIYEMTCK